MVDEEVVNEAGLRAVFDAAPVSLWIEDFSAIKDRLDALRADGIVDLHRYIDEHPTFVHECLGMIKVVDVNQRTLELYCADSKQQLIDRVEEVFRDAMATHFASDLVLMWAGKPGQETEGVNYTLTGQPIDIHLQWTVLPGHEERWDRALVSITDITARKRSDEYLRYLGTHDTLTGLFNRSHFDEQVRRLPAVGDPIASLLIADLNGLKQINDQFGHSAGDLMIRRAGEVLIAATEDEDIAARIGGDEFAVLLPGRDEAAAAAMVRRIEELVEHNNRSHDGQPLQVAIGSATMRAGTTFGEAFKLADQRMYEHKATASRD